jgi:signal transduction histidine kinase
VVDYCCDLLNGEIKQSGAVIDYRPEGWHIINYPKIYLESIMMNLMSNSLKYRSDTRTPVITITTSLDNGLYTLKFSDNGSGIDLVKHKDNVFKLYKTFHAAKPGKGLGLFMTKSQIETMGGEITVDSVLGEGTTFTIIFNKEKIPAEGTTA